MKHRWMFVFVALLSQGVHAETPLSPVTDADAAMSCVCLYDRPYCDPYTMKCEMICARQVCLPDPLPPPQACNQNGVCDLGENSLACASDCPTSLCQEGARMTWGGGIGRCEGNVKCLNSCANGEAHDGTLPRTGFARFLCTQSGWQVTQQYCDGEETPIP
jgi:hypothetical protein